MDEGEHSSHRGHHVLLDSWRGSDSLGEQAGGGRGQRVGCMGTVATSSSSTSSTFYNRINKEFFQRYVS